MTGMNVTHSMLRIIIQTHTGTRYTIEVANNETIVLGLGVDGDPFPLRIEVDDYDRDAEGRPDRDDRRYFGSSVIVR